MKAEHVRIVVREPQFPEKVPRLIAEQTGATLVKMPIHARRCAAHRTYIKMIDYNVDTLLAAAGKHP